MKRTGLFLLIAVLLAGIVSAQGLEDRQDKGGRQNKVERLNRDSGIREFKIETIEGTLQLEKGFVAVKSGEDVFIVPMLTRYIGFIEGLKEGAKVTVEGVIAKNFVYPKKANINGKDYEFTAQAHHPGFGSRFFTTDRRNNRRGRSCCT